MKITPTTAFLLENVTQELRGYQSCQISTGKVLTAFVRILTSA